MFCSHVGLRKPEVLDVAILGFGGRVQCLLLESLQLRKETNKEFRVVAICDDFARQSLAFFVEQLNKQKPPLLAIYTKMFEKSVFYQDNELGLKELFLIHRHLDRVFITSANHRHFAHFQSALGGRCRNIFIEKPVFKSLDEYLSFQTDTSRATIHVGLCLRYTRMARIAEAKFREHREALGQLQKVRSWELVNFGHALSIIMMNWRRYKSLSGGLLIEKAVHDLDLALFFMQAAGMVPRTVTVSTKVFHEFFKKSREQEIVSHLMEDELLRKNVENWDTASWQRKIAFSRLESGAIDWTATMENFFREFPMNDDFTDSDIIPDRHILTAEIEDGNGHLIDFKLETKLNEFAQNTQRGMAFQFEKGIAEIDIGTGMMVIEMDSISQAWELHIDTQGHAGGDTYVAHALLGTLPQGQHQALFQDQAVQLSMLMALVSEKQASLKEPEEVRLTQVENRWVVQETAIVP